jgi:hypothetical protein
MTLTPFMILILTGYALFIGVLGVVSIWSNGGAWRASVAKAKPMDKASALPSPTILTLRDSAHNR